MVASSSQNSDGVVRRDSCPPPLRGGAGVRLSLRRGSLSLSVQTEDHDLICLDLPGAGGSTSQFTQGRFKTCTFYAASRVIESMVELKYGESLPVGGIAEYLESEALRSPRSPVYEAQHYGATIERVVDAINFESDTHCSGGSGGECEGVTGWASVGASLSASREEIMKRNGFIVGDKHTGREWCLTVWAEPVSFESLLKVALSPGGTFGLAIAVAVIKVDSEDGKRHKHSVAICGAQPGDETALAALNSWGSSQRRVLVNAKNVVSAAFIWTDVHAVRAHLMGKVTTLPPLRVSPAWSHYLRVLGYETPAVTMDGVVRTISEGQNSPLTDPGKALLSPTGTTRLSATSSANSTPRRIVSPADPRLLQSDTVVGSDSTTTAPNAASSDEEPPTTDGDSSAAGPTSTAFGTKVYTHAGVYTGELLTADGSAGETPHGFGKMVYSNGETYVGEWSHGERDGLGVAEHVGPLFDPADGAAASHPAADVVLEQPIASTVAGQWDKGVIAGLRVQQFTGGTVIAGEAVEVDGDIRSHGVAVWKCSNEDRTGITVAGEFEEGVPEGCGIKILPDGEKVAGEIRSGKTHGLALSVDASGEKYAGEFAAGKRHGRGTEWSNGGVERVGEWVENDLVEGVEIVYKEEEGASLTGTSGSGGRLTI